MSILQAIDTLRRWFEKHNIPIEPSKFRIRIEFDDICDYAHFETAVRRDIVNSPTAWYTSEGKGLRGDRIQVMGVEIICTPPRRGCDCPSCQELYRLGWRK